jgi:hypothetical protein
MICWWMNSMAPISTPRVGWPTAGARVAVDLAGQHDLLLVAARESLRAGSIGFGGRTSKRAILSTQSAFIAALSIRGPEF